MSRLREWSAAVLCLALLAGCRAKGGREESVRQGDELFAKEQYRAAAAAYRAALAAGPVDPALQAKLGEALAAAGDSVRAADLLADDLDVQLKAAEAMLAKGRFEDVQVRLEETLRTHPDNARVLVLHANALARLAESGSALFELADKVGNPRRFAAARVDLRPRVQSSDEQKAEAELRQAMTLAPNDPTPGLALANLYWATDRLAEAEPLLRAFTAEQRGHAAANHALGAYYLATGRGADADPYLLNAAGVAGVFGRPARFTLADHYIATKRNADARALLGSMLADEDGDGDVSLRLAQLDAADGNAPAAVRRLDATLRRKPGMASALLLKARVLLAMGNPDPKYARAAVAVDPTSSEARMLLGDVLVAGGDTDGALAEYRQAVRRDPKDVVPRLALVRALLLVGDGREALPVARDAARLAPDDTDAVLSLVSANMAVKAYADAASALAPLLAKHPAEPSVAIAEGRLLAARESAPAARAAFLRALAAAPDSLDALAGLVEVESGGRPSPETAQRVEAALAARPGDPSLMLVAARLFSSTGQHARAETLLRRAFVMEPGNVALALALADTLRVSGRTDEAIAILKQLVARRPSRVTDVRVSLATLLDAAGRRKEALEQHEQVILEDPGRTDTALWLASAYVADQAKLIQALELAMTAKRGRPNDPDVDLVLGRVYTARKLGGLAVPALQRAVNARPGNALYHFHLGAAYEMSGSLSQARAEYTRALELDANFEGAEKARQMTAGRR